MRTSTGCCLAIVSTSTADDPVNGDGDGNDVGDAGEVDDDDD